MIRTGMTSMLAVALSIAACRAAPVGKIGDAQAATGTAPSSATTTAQTAPTPAPTEGYDWYSRLDDGERSLSMVLAYEMPDTDDQPLAFACEEGGRRVFAMHDSGLPDQTTLTLASADQTRTLPASAEHSELSGGDYLTTELASEDALLAAFRTTGAVTLTSGGEARVLAAHPGSGATERIAAFLDFCAG